MAEGESDSGKGKAGAVPGGGCGGGLCVNNSLAVSGVKTAFVPSSGDRRVTWYICGPTVYDVSHVGHARTYLSFDIIRRILEDYFGFEVFYVMNVTDVDDKIIARARGNHLVEKYMEEVNDPAKAVADVLSALDKAIEKQESKVAESKAAVASAATDKLREDMEEQLAQEELKLQQRRDARRAIESDIAPKAIAAGGALGVAMLLVVEHGAVPQDRATTEAAEAKADAAANGPTSLAPDSSQSPDAVAAAVEQAHDALAAVLDKEKGASVTDASIFRKHSAKYEKEFMEDMKALGVRPPHVLTRVTEYIDVIIQYVDKIVSRGFAYACNGSVYFDTRAFSESGHEYGKLCPWAVDNTERASESEANFTSTEKKNKSDFALWKASKPGEPMWESPWGKGRPGWHIECSAMASDVIGGTIDIHSGGIDLRFPHHTNELAQAEAFYDSHEWVRYFLHTGHLHIEGRKMSKSLKNFITIRQALEKNSARQIRMLFLMQAWDKNMQFGEAALAEAANREKQFKNFFQTVRAECRAVAGSDCEESWGTPEKELHSALWRAQDEVHKALENNFDTPSALLALLGVVTAVNIYLSSVASLARTTGKPRTVRPLLLQQAADYVARILQVFGLMDGGGVDDFGGTTTSTSDGAQNKEDMLAPYLVGFSSFRDSVRAAARRNAPKEEMLALTDRVRDFDMVDLGIRCEDRAGEAAALVKLDDPEVLRKERDDRLRKAAEEAAKKLQTKRAARLKDLQKWETSAVPPNSIFRNATDKYSAWDPDLGLPTHDASGKELSAKAKKGVEKELKKAEEAHSKYVQKVEQEPGFLDALRQEIASLDDEIARISSSSAL